MPLEVPIGMEAQATSRPGLGHSVAPSRPSPPPPTERAWSDLRRALAGVRDDLGFDTASLFAGGPDGWRLLDRQGPERAWHGVLDPSALEGTPEAAEYPDARTIPGIGPRLAALGCASVASLPLPDGSRLILDARTPCPPGGWVERSRPYLDLMAIMAGPVWPSAGALRTQEEVAALQRVFVACQDILGSQGTALDDLLEGVREAIRADEVYFVAERGSELWAVASPVRGLPLRLPRNLRSKLSAADGVMAEGTLRQLAVALGVASRAVAGSFGRDTDGLEVTLAGWATRPAMSSVSMAIVSRTLSTGRAALMARRRAVARLNERERLHAAGAIHDGLTQVVTGAVLELQALRQTMTQKPEQAAAALEASEREIRAALAELRRMLRQLEQGEPGNGGSRLDRMVEDVVTRWGLPRPEVRVEGDLASVPEPLRHVAFDVVREALTNAAKHAPGAPVTVTVSVGLTHLDVAVGDHGRGFTRLEETAARQQNHMGLDLLRRRVREAGGRLQIQSRPGAGTRVTAHLPLQEAAS